MPHYKMIPWYFLVVEDNIGDAFTYKILPLDDIITLHGKVKHISRSVFRLRDSNTPNAHIVIEENDVLRFYDCKGKELVGDTILNQVKEKDM